MREIRTFKGVGYYLLQNIYTYEEQSVGKTAQSVQ